jgi:hypothetical protein
MLNTATLCNFDQLLRAAQLLEHQQTAAAAALKMSLLSSAVEQPLQFCKLGEDYQERLVASKMRPILEQEQQRLGASSTGSSRRSSPVSSLFSNCSSAQSTSPPNSPSTILISSMPMTSQMPPIAETPTASSSSPFSASPLNAASHSRSSPGSTRQSRAAHNELEKNRRANLRSYLDKLKTVLPTDVDSTRDTTLSLLTRARNHLKVIREQKEALLEQRKTLLAENARLCAQQQSDQLPAAVQPQIEAPMLDNVAILAAQVQPSPIAAPEPLVTSAVKLCFTPPAAFLEQLNLGGGTTSPAVSVAENNTKSFGSSGVDFCMEGLLPAIPLLYPYTTNTATTVTAHLSY